jgi:hypothetical protein
MKYIVDFVSLEISAMSKPGNKLTRTALDWELLRCFLVHGSEVGVFMSRPAMSLLLTPHLPRILLGP